LFYGKWRLSAKTTEISYKRAKLASVDEKRGSYRGRAEQNDLVDRSHAQRNTQVVRDVTAAGGH